MTDRPILVRALGIGIYSLLIGLWLAHDVWRKHSMGRVAYLASQDKYYDKWLANLAHPNVHTVGYAIFIATAVLLYELVVYLLRRLLAAAS